MSNQFAETPSGAINSSNVTFTLQFAPNPSASLQLFLNGLLQKQGSDYTLSSFTITFITAPTTGDTLLAFYLTGASASGGFGPSAQDVVNSVADDLLMRLAPEDPILLDYINRVQLQLLRVSRWQFLLSAPQRFTTQEERTDYWIGPVGTGPLGVYDTGLNLTNLGPIKTDTVYDRSNFRSLKKTLDIPNLSRFSQRDVSARPGQPRLWKNSPDAPNVLSLYPAPDNQNNYQPQPEAPQCGTTSGGSLAARIYFLRATYVDSLGNESSASDEARIFVPANSVVTVNPPIEVPTAASGVTYTKWNLYIFNAGSNLQTTTGQETLVTASPLSTGSIYTEPNTGFTTGGRSFPTANNLETIGGYVIEFRYFTAKPQVTSLTDTLLIPQDYFDVMVAGVNYFAANFIKDADAVQYWKAEYQSGITGMIRDKNLFPRGPDYVSPDSAAQSYTNFYGFETFDTTFLPSA